MKTQRQVKTLNRDELAGRHGEGSTAPKGDSSKNSIAHDTQMYHRIVRDAKAAKVYGDNAGDIAHDTWVIARERGYYCKKMLQEAARNAGLWAEAAEIDIGTHDEIKTEEKEEKDERIDIIIKNAGDKVAKVIALARLDYNLTDCCDFIGISYSNFVRQAGQAYSQPSLFGGAR